jgi:hypothetical protein
LFFAVLPFCAQLYLQPTFIYSVRLFDPDGMNVLYSEIKKKRWGAAEMVSRKQSLVFAFPSPSSFCRSSGGISFAWFLRWVLFVLSLVSKVRFEFLYDDRQVPAQQQAEEDPWRWVHPHLVLSSILHMHGFDSGTVRAAWMIFSSSFSFCSLCYSQS